MDKKEVTVSVSYGLMNDALEEQLEKQGFTLGDKAEHFEEQKKRIYHLLFGELLTDGEFKKVLGRLHKEVMKKIELLEEK